MFEADPCVVPLRFDQDEFVSERRLKIGYFTHIPGYPVAECIKGAVLKCVEGFEDCEVVEYEFSNANEIISAFLDLYAANYKAEFEMDLNGEAPENYYKLKLFLYDHPYITKMALALLRMLKNDRLARFFDSKMRYLHRHL